jgi:hypothetical protein
MPVTATTAQELFIGAGEVYVDGLPVGATKDNNVFRVTREYFAPDLNGTPGPIKGTDYVQSETAELEVSIPELDPTKLSHIVPGSVATAGDAQGVAKSGGANTTLAANTSAGATQITVASASGIAIGDILQIGATGSREFRQVAAVAGTTIDLIGALSKAHSSGDPVVEVEATTLAADAPAGSTNLKVASVTGLSVGDYVRFGYPGEQEVRRLTFVGTAGVGGTGVSFFEPTQLAHRSGDMFLEQTSSGASTIASTSGTSRRLPSTAYHEWELRVPGLDGREIRFVLRNAIMTDNAEFEAADDGELAPRLKLQARWDPANITQSAWEIQKLGPTA